MPARPTPPLRSEGERADRTPRVSESSECGRCSSLSPKTLCRPCPVGVGSHHACFPQIRVRPWRHRRRRVRRARRTAARAPPGQPALLPLARTPHRPPHLRRALLALRLRFPEIPRYPVQRRAEQYAHVQRRTASRRAHSTSPATHSLRRRAGSSAPGRRAATNRVTRTAATSSTSTAGTSAYFARLKAFLAHASDRHVVVEMNLFCPMYRTSVGAQPDERPQQRQRRRRRGRTNVYTLERTRIAGGAGGDDPGDRPRLRDYDNLYYEVCNEPYFGGVTLDWQHRIVETIVATERDFRAST